MILVVTRKHDVHGAHIYELLRKQGEEVQLLDYEQYPQELEISFQTDDEGERLVMRFPNGETVDGQEVKSVLNRRQAEPKASSDIRSPRITDYIVRESRNFLDALPQMLKCFWFSDPDAVRVASRKPHQLAVARRIGFRVPPTLVTNSPTEARFFAGSLSSDVACKALWTPGITLDREGKETGVALYTRRIKPAQVIENSGSIKNCPLILQAYVEKSIELRITVVGKRVFACAIHSQQSERTKEDWRRYDLANTPHEPYRLPLEVETRCVRLVEELHLSFGCIDMIVTPSGEYVFLEINPNGQWLWIEHLTGMPISQAIAELLANPPKS